MLLKKSGASVLSATWSRVQSGSGPIHVWSLRISLPRFGLLSFCNVPSSQGTCVNAHVRALVDELSAWICAGAVRIEFASCGPFLPGLKPCRPIGRFQHGVWNPDRLPCGAKARPAALLASISLSSPSVRYQPALARDREKDGQTHWRCPPSWCDVSAINVKKE
jgi:hypothetical protein